MGPQHSTADILRHLWPHLFAFSLHQRHLFLALPSIHNKFFILFTLILQLNDTTLFINEKHSSLFIIAYFCTCLTLNYSMRTVVSIIDKLSSLFLLYLIFIRYKISQFFNYRWYRTIVTEKLCFCCKTVQLTVVFCYEDDVTF